MKLKESSSRLAGLASRSPVAAAAPHHCLVILLLRLGSTRDDVQLFAHGGEACCNHLSHYELLVPVMSVQRKRRTLLDKLLILGDNLARIRVSNWRSLGSGTRDTPFGNIIIVLHNGLQHPKSRYVG